MMQKNERKDGRKNECKQACLFFVHLFSPFLSFALSLSILHVSMFYLHNNNRTEKEKKEKESNELCPHVTSYSSTNPVFFTLSEFHIAALIRENLGC